MSTLPTNLKHIALFFERLPGIGEKTANRLAMYLWRLAKDLSSAMYGSVISHREAMKLIKME